MLAPGYWPWWLGAASLAVVTVGSCVVARRPLGVSGIVGRFVDLRAELTAERQRRAMARNEAEIQAMLLAMTAEAFGPAGAEPGASAPAPDPGPGPGVAAAQGSLAVVAGQAAARAGCRSCGSPSSRPTLGAHAVFLLAIVGGGLAVQLARGGWSPSFGLGPTFSGLFGEGVGAIAALGAGGFLVGLGTTVSGGCSTGHGLSGCSRLQPGSIVATAVFLAAAVAVSFLLAGSRS